MLDQRNRLRNGDKARGICDLVTENNLDMLVFTESWIQNDLDTIAMGDNYTNWIHTEQHGAEG